MTRACRIIARMAALMALPLTALGTAGAQQLDASFSCSTRGSDQGEAVTYADHGEIRIDGERIAAFRWESSLYRSTHGFDCSIDQEDGLRAETIGDEDGRAAWRVSLVDAIDARARRGYDFFTRVNCTIRIVRDGDTVDILPSCPALCGSRTNFSALSVNLKTGDCRHQP